jgi:hypothetical protein
VQWRNARDIAMRKGAKTLAAIQSFLGYLRKGEESANESL